MTIFDYRLAGPGLIDGEDRVIMSISADSVTTTYAITADDARRFADDILRAANIIDPLQDEEFEYDLNMCPNCGGPADNGFSREIPPSPYFCTKCMRK